VKGWVFPYEPMFVYTSSRDKMFEYPSHCPDRRSESQSSQARRCVQRTPALPQLRDYLTNEENPGSNCWR
jgi:hypothetical protein